MLRVSLMSWQANELIFYLCHPCTCDAVLHPRIVEMMKLQINSIQYFNGSL